MGPQMTKCCGCGSIEHNSVETNIMSYSNQAYSSPNNTLKDLKTPNHFSLIQRLTYINWVNRIIRAYRRYKHRQTQLMRESNQSALFKPSASASKYIGSRNVRGLKDGFGAQKWEDGTKFIGQFKNGRANGWNICYHSDGDEYNGMMVNDSANGYGIYHHSNGGVYEGCWFNSFQCGIGIEKWSNASVFKGEYDLGKKNGIGTYKWQDGTMYSGEWKDNNMHGFGIYSFGDGRQYIGQWNQNQMNGYGEFSWKDGKVYAGFYKNDQKEGFGIYYDPSLPKCYIGFWKEGKKHGASKIIQQSHAVYSIWISGNRDQQFQSEMDLGEWLNQKEEKYKRFFSYELNDIEEYFALDDTSV